MKICLREIVYKGMAINCHVSRNHDMKQNTGKQQKKCAKNTLTSI